MIMNREKLFEEFINECEKEPLTFCGQGNPNADILIIGKESTDTSEALIRDKIRLCRDKVNRDAPRDINSQNKTWCYYQKLIDEIYQRKSEEPNKWDFEKLAFTTEMNNIPSKRSYLTKEIKDGINKRLQFFKDSRFIKSFPVVILACSNYINNDKKNGYQINQTFGVEFDNEPNSDGSPIGEHKKKYPTGFWFYTHHSKDKQKLVIHTVQLSQIQNDMIKDMANEIRDHLTKLGKI